MLKETARLIWNCAIKRPVFAVGSSGLTHGLLLHWRSIGLIRAAKAPPPAKPVDRLLVLSGSCSPVTAKQIRRAKAAWVSPHWRLHGSCPLECPVCKGLQRSSEAAASCFTQHLGPQRKDGKSRRRFGAALWENFAPARPRVRRAPNFDRRRRHGDSCCQAIGLDALTFAASLCPASHSARGHAVAPRSRPRTRAQRRPDGSRRFFAQVRDGNCS